MNFFSLFVFCLFAFIFSQCNCLTLFRSREVGTGVLAGPALQKGAELSQRLAGREEALQRAMDEMETAGSAVMEEAPVVAEQVAAALEATPTALETLQAMSTEELPWIVRSGQVPPWLSSESNQLVTQWREFSRNMNHPFERSRYILRNPEGVLEFLNTLKSADYGTIISEERLVTLFQQAMRSS